MGTMLGLTSLANIFGCLLSVFRTLECTCWIIKLVNCCTQFTAWIPWFRTIMLILLAFMALALLDRKVPLLWLVHQLAPTPKHARPSLTHLSPQKSSRPWASCMWSTSVKFSKVLLQLWSKYRTSIAGEPGGNYNGVISFLS